MITIVQLGNIELKKNIMLDLLWNYPDDSYDGWLISPRGCGLIFGWKVVEAFCHINNLELICRAHQLVMEGFQYYFEKKQLCTVWSAPNYCYRCGNK